MKVFVTCVGCEQRDLDAQQVIDFVSARGGVYVPSPELCDFAIVITCTVDKRLSAQSVLRIAETKERMPAGSKLLVGGCLPATYPELVRPFEPLSVFSPRSMDRLEVFLESDSQIMWGAVPHANRSVFDQSASAVKESYGNARAAYDRAKRGFKVIIARGCLGSCSYCVIRIANGSLESVPAASVLRQIEAGIQEGEKTVMLMGGDTGAYGQDIGTNLPELLLAIVMTTTPHNTLYLHDLGPRWVIHFLDQLLSLFSIPEAQCRINTLCIPIQSGSDRILNSMRRGYTSAAIRDAIDKLRQASPQLVLGTHVITGFPGETNDDVKETIYLLSECKFDFVTCFPYCDHKQAPANRISNKVSADIVQERMSRIEMTVSNVKILG